MSNIWNSIKEAIRRFFSWCKNLVTKIINGILKFIEHVVNWFKSLHLIKGKHTPFIGNGKSQEFKNMLRNAPEVKVDGLFDENKPSIIEGVYNEETDQIDELRVVGADELDEETKQVLGNNPLVVLN